MKSSTHSKFLQARDSIVAYFGKTKKLKDVTVADAKNFRIWLTTEGNRRDKVRKGLADDTVRRTIGRAKEFYAEAIERGIVDANPFDKIPVSTRGNEKNQRFVTVAEIKSCIEAAPCNDWRLILALTRYGGLRCPSEIVRLRWQDIDLPASRMTLHAPKTEHQPTGGVRVCPIFTELRPFLEDAWDKMPAGESSEFVINRYRSETQNLRTTFEKIIKRAGLTPWPRLF